jgi:hypothetical protein
VWARACGAGCGVRRTGGACTLHSAETKMSGSIELGHRNKRHGALGDNGHLFGGMAWHGFSFQFLFSSPPLQLPLLPESSDPQLQRLN